VVFFNCSQISYCYVSGGIGLRPGFEESLQSRVREYSSTDDISIAWRFRQLWVIGELLEPSIGGVSHRTEEIPFCMLMLHVLNSYVRQ